MKIAVLVPCFNEELTIGKVVTDFKKELPQAEIYVYDNNSTDRTIQIAKEKGAIIGKESKQGKGNVVRKMFQEIEADIYIMVDGDNTYPANEIDKLIYPILSGEADMVIGDRLTNKTYYKENKNIFHKFGNILVTKAINFAFKQNLKDIMSGYRVFNRKFVKNIPITSHGFELETQITINALDKNFNIKEIPIIYKERKGNKTKVKTVPDGIKVIGTIIKMFKDTQPRKFFSIIALILAILGILVGTPVIIEFLKTAYISKVPSAILATGIVILSIIIAQCGFILDTVVKQNRENYELQLIRWIEQEKNKKL